LRKYNIFQIDKDDTGSISLPEYFGIFSAHGIVVDKAETSRVIRLAGDDEKLSKDKFLKIMQGSDFFMKSFDKNKDGEVTEVKSFIKHI
jgi:Ca2+-binding EF-hand superfamily protein